MYYKIRDCILFRKYSRYGYITDNSDFGYRNKKINTSFIGEKYISESGAVMLAALDKTPRHIDEITSKLLRIFKNVDDNILKQDTIDFFNTLSHTGYLDSGETYEECLYAKKSSLPQKNNAENVFINKDEYEYSVLDNDLLRSLHIEIVKGCNERCIHCFIPPDTAKEIMDINLFFRILEEGSDLNIINVTLSGGEPLLHPNFIQFLKKCYDKDLSVNVLSNLTLLNDEMVEEMINNPLLSVQTSIYSMNHDIHDAITNHKGSFEKTKNNLLKLYSAGIPIQISCPVMKKNKDSFIDVLHFGRELGVLVAIEPIIFPTYDRSRSNLKNRLSLNELEEVIKKRLFAGQGHQILENAKDKEKIGEDESICTICRYKLCISPNGDIFPCVGWHTNILGNLRQETLRNIWENSLRIHSLRQIKRKQFQKCVTCKDRGYCTVCMMSNSNGHPDGDIFYIDDFNCKAASLLHKMLKKYVVNKRR